MKTIALYKPMGAVFTYRRGDRWIQPRGIRFYHHGRTGAMARMLFSRLGEHERAVCIEAWHRGCPYKFRLTQPSARGGEG